MSFEMKYLATKNFVAAHADARERARAPQKLDGTFARATAGRMTPQATAVLSPLSTLADLADAFLRHEERRVAARLLSPRTLTNRRHGLAWLGDVSLLPLADLTAGRIDSWITDLAALPGRVGPGHGRAKLAYDGLRRLLSWCVLQDLLPANPAREVRFRYRARAVSSVPDGHLRRVAAALEAGRESRRARAEGRRLAARLAAPSAGLVVLGTGCRAGEAACALAEDWDEDALQLELRRSKNRRRVLAVPAGLAPVLREQRELVGGAGPLFPSPRRDGPICELTVWRTVAAAGELAGVRLWPHKLRHAFARRALRRGRSVEQIADALGDSPQTVLEHYLRGEETPVTRQIVDDHGAMLFGRGGRAC